MSFIPIQPTLLLSGGNVSGVLTLSGAGTALVVNNNVSIAGSLTMGGAVSITAGNLNLSNGSVFVASTGDTLFQAAGLSGNQKLFRAVTGSSARWDVGSNNTTEGGTNTGSNFVIHRYNDAGTLVDTPLTIARNTGTLTYIDPVSISGPLTAANVTITGGLSVAAALTASSSINAASMSITGTLTVTGAVTTNAITASGAILGSSISAQIAGQGQVWLSTGGTNNTGYIAFFNSAGTRQGYIGFGAAGSTLALETENGTTGWLVTGCLTSNGGIVANAYDTGGLNVRTVSGKFGAGLRNDGAMAYFLSTDSGAPLGSYNSFRPFYWDLTSGAVGIDATAAGVTLGGAITVSGVATFNGYEYISGTGPYMIGTGTEIAPTGWGWGIALDSPSGISASGFLAVSDARAKTDINDIMPSEGSDWVRRGRPRTFLMAGRPSAGFIAQEDIIAGRYAAVSSVSDADPRFADGDGIAAPGKRLIRDYNHDIAYLTAALQDALARIAALESAGDPQ